MVVGGDDGAGGLAVLVVVWLSCGGGLAVVVLTEIVASCLQSAVAAHTQ